MKRSWLIKIKELLSRFSKKPWACFETGGPDSAGRVAFSISYNPAFVKNLQQLGMAGENDEETVQMFFIQMRMVPEEMAEPSADMSRPEINPLIVGEDNTIVRG